MAARYVFAVTFRLEPESGVEVDPETFETRLYRPADEPGEPGWLFFRDNLWRGDLADPEHFRALTEEVLDVSVLAVEYRAFETDEDSLAALRSAIADDLAECKADSVDRAIAKYFGSSIEVR